ncbi:MAG: hypothetical protein AAFQ79_15760 [Pseudomonadota bacterium]
MKFLYQFDGFLASPLTGAGMTFAFAALEKTEPWATLWRIQTAFRKVISTITLI